MLPCHGDAGPSSRPTALASRPSLVLPCRRPANTLSANNKPPSRGPEPSKARWQVEPCPIRPLKPHALAFPIRQIQQFRHAWQWMLRLRNRSTSATARREQQVVAYNACSVRLSTDKLLGQRQEIVLPSLLDLGGDKWSRSRPVSR